MGNFWSGGGSAALSGGLGLIGSLISGAQQKKENKRNRKWQRQMYDLSVQNNREDAETAYNRQVELTNLQSQLSYQNEQNIERNRFKNTVQGAKDAGVNIGLALNGGNAGNAAGGVAVPQVSQAHSGSAPMPNSAPIPPIQTALDLSMAKLNEALAKKNTEEAKTEEATREGTVKNLEANYKKIMQDVEESKKRIALMASSVNLNESQTRWQNFQNNILENTQGTRIKAVEWELKNLKASYRQLMSQAGLNYSLSARNNIANRYASRYWSGLVENLSANTKLTGQKFLTEKENTNNAAWEGLFNGLGYDIQEATKQGQIDLINWKADEQKKWESKFEKTLGLEKRGQNMKLAGTIVNGLLDIGSMLILKKPKFGIGTHQKSVKYKWDGKRFVQEYGTDSWWE